MFDGEFQVGGHASGQPDRARVAAQYPPVLLSQPGEALVGIGAQRRYAHQTDELQTVAGGHLGADLVDVLRLRDVDAAT